MCLRTPPRGSAIMGREPDGAPGPLRETEPRNRHWDGSATWLRSQVAAGKVTNIKVNPKVAMNLGDDGNGGDIVTVEGTAELGDTGPDDVESAYLAKYDEPSLVSASRISGCARR